MATRGFVGYQLQNVIRGWYNHFDSYYSGLGIAVLDKFERHTQEELLDFFVRRLRLVPDKDGFLRVNQQNPFTLDWSKDYAVLPDDSDFLNDGLFCEYGYVFNLNNDELDVYRGFFKAPQRRGQGYSEGFDGTKYYTHRVLTIRRQDITAARQVFMMYEELPDWAHELCPYPERQLLAVLSARASA